MSTASTQARTGSLYVQTIVESFCSRHGLAYCQGGLFDFYAQALRHLHAVGRTAYSAGV